MQTKWKSDTWLNKLTFKKFFSPNNHANQKKNFCPPLNALNLKHVNLIFYKNIKMFFKYVLEINKLSITISANY